MVQSEHHPFFSNAEVRRVCAAHGIADCVMCGALAAVAGPAPPAQAEKKLAADPKVIAGYQQAVLDEAKAQQKWSMIIKNVVIIGICVA